MSFRIYIIDSFTNKKFSGNPTAVCEIDQTVDALQMQMAAKELNLPVTAFVRRIRDTNHFNIYYFTPVAEIPACGHATLAAADAIRVTHAVQPVFITINQIEIETAHVDGITWMSYPVYNMEHFIVSKNLLGSLGIENYKTAGYCEPLETLFIETEANVLRNIKPDFQLMLSSSDRIKEVVITSASDEQAYDYLLRSFCPWIGIDEDPVTGSVHSVLAGYWKERSQKTLLKAYQASERGGELFLRPEREQVGIGGQSVSVLRGEISF